jgi:hypothetical protein
MTPKVRKTVCFAACLVALLAAAAAISASPSSGRGIQQAVAIDREPAAPTPVGIVARLGDRSDAELQHVAAKLQASGVTFIREDVDWSTIQPHPGHTYWGSMDRWVAAAAEHDLQIMGVLGSSPEWIAPQWNDPPTSGPQLEAFSAFVREALARYGSNGSFWQEHPGLPADPIEYWDIWNEPYVARFWGPGPPDPAAYARMFKSVVQASQGADPSSRFMLEADTRIVSSGWPWKPFLAAMFDAVPDLGKYAYGVSVHPYQGEGASPRACTPFTRSPGVQARWQATALQFCRITDIRRFLDDHGAAALKLWITEVGWSTAPEAELAVSEETQARYVQQTFDLLHTTDRGLVSGLIWYEYQSAEASPTELDDYFGLVRPDGEPKAAWRVFVEEATSGL